MKQLLPVLSLLGCVLPACASLTINADVIKNSAVFIYPPKPDGKVDSEKPLGAEGRQ